METLSTGPNTHYVDGPVIHTVLGGDTNREIIVQYLELVRRVAKQHGRAFLLIDNQRSFMMDAGARQALFQFSREHLVAASAMVGGGQLYRTAVNLLLRALELARIAPTPTVFFSTPEQAREWIDQQRLRQASKQPPASSPNTRP